MGTLLSGITLWVSDSATISGISQHLVDAVIVYRFVRHLDGLLLRGSFCAP